MESILQGEGIDAGEVAAWLSLFVAVVATLLSVFALVRVEQANRLGMEFRLAGSGLTRRVNNGPYHMDGSATVVPRGPGMFYDVYVTAWPADEVDFLGADDKPLETSAVASLCRKRLTAEGEPFRIRYRRKSGGPGVESPGPQYLGVVWEQPGLWGGFVPGGWRVRLDLNENDPGERWSRSRKAWVPLPPSSEPEKHPVYGSILVPESPEA